MTNKQSSKQGNKVIIVGGGKGGVGKSTTTLAIVDALLTNGKQVVVVESDDSNPDVYASLNGLVTCEDANLDNEAGYIKLGNIIQANEQAYVVVNTAARATRALVDFGGIIADVCKEQNRELVMVFAMNRQRDSVILLKTFLDGATGYAATYALKNTYFGSPEKFSRFDSSAQKKRVTGVLELPELNDLLADKLNDNSLALSNATEGLTIAERSVLTRYRNAVQKVFEVL